MCTVLGYGLGTKTVSTNKKKYPIRPDCIGVLKPENPHPSSVRMGIVKEREGGVTVTVTPGGAKDSKNRIFRFFGFFC